MTSWHIIALNLVVSGHNINASKHYVTINKEGSMNALLQGKMAHEIRSYHMISLNQAKSGKDCVQLMIRLQ